MKKFLLSVAAMLLSVGAFAQDEPTVTKSLDASNKPVFQFKSNEIYYYIHLSDDVINNSGIPKENFVYIGPKDEEGRKLWYWTANNVDTNLTITDGDNTGDNCFGTTGGFYAWKVTTFGWSGLGFVILKSSQGATPLDLSGITDEFTFHMALRSSNAAPAFDLYLVDAYKNSAHMILGKNGQKVDGNAASANITRDGQWYDVEYPMTWLADQYELVYDNADAMIDQNYFCANLGGTRNVELDVDAVFFRGPKPTTDIKTINTTDNAATAKRQGVYTLDGKFVAPTTEGLQKGIYVVNSSRGVRKVAIK